MKTIAGIIFLFSFHVAAEAKLPETILESHIKNRVQDAGAGRIESLHRELSEYETDGAQFSLLPVDDLIKKYDDAENPVAAFETYCVLLHALYRYNPALTGQFEPFLKHGNEWLERFPNASQRKYTECLIRELLPALEEFIPQLILHADSLKTVEHPKYESFVIQNLSFSGISFTRRMEFGETTLNLNWNDTRYPDFPLRLWMKTPNADAGFKQNLPLAAWLLAAGNKSAFQNLLDTFPAENNDVWRQLAADVFALPDIASLLAKLKKAEELERQQQWRELEQILKNIRGKIRMLSDAFEARVDLLESSCVPHIPALLSKHLINQAESIAATEPERARKLMKTAAIRTRLQGQLRTRFVNLRERLMEVKSSNLQVLEQQAFLEAASGAWDRAAPLYEKAFETNVFEAPLALLPELYRIRGFYAVRFDKSGGLFDIWRNRIQSAISALDDRPVMQATLSTVHEDIKRIKQEPFYSFQHIPDQLEQLGVEETAASLDRLIDRMASDSDPFLPDAAWIAAGLHLASANNKRAEELLFFAEQSSVSHPDLVHAAGLYLNKSLDELTRAVLLRETSPNIESLWLEMCLKCKEGNQLAAQTCIRKAQNHVEKNAKNDEIIRLMKQCYSIMRRPQRN